jgi:hypothetical protein
MTRSEDRSALALTLTLSPKEREQPWRNSGFAMAVLNNPATSIHMRRRIMLPLLGERAGVREVVSTKALNELRLVLCTQPRSNK